MLIKKILWAESAQTDILGILRHIQEQEGDRELAEETYRRIRQAALRLISFPVSGRMGRMEGVREVVIKNLPYILHYSVEDDVVNIVRVFHTSREPLRQHA